MRKNCSLMLTLLALMFALTAPTYAQSIPQDVDGDGLVTPTDAIFLLNRLGETLSGDWDLNDNDTVDQDEVDAVIAALGWQMPSIVIVLRGPDGQSASPNAPTDADFFVDTDNFVVNDIDETSLIDDPILTLTGEDILTANEAGIAPPDGEGVIIWGNDNNNIIVASSNDDIIYGEDGEQDILVGDSYSGGGDGDDIIFGGAGDDFIFGDSFAGDGSGDDILYGGPRDDVIIGDSRTGNGSGNDRIFGNEDNDVLDGDSFSGDGSGNDIIDGGTGNDNITGDSVTGNGSGDDIIDGGEGDDRTQGSGYTDDTVENVEDRTTETGDTP